VDLVAFIAVVANTTLLVNAPFFLVTFLGKGTNKWLAALLAFRILCIYGMLRVVTEAVGPCLMARGLTKPLLVANLIAGAVEIGLLFLALRSGRIEMVAYAVLIAYASQAIIYLPLLRREFLVSFVDIVAKIWPVFPALTVGWLATSLLPNSFGNTLITLGIRGLFTALVVCLAHGIFSKFRCFQEMSGMISKNFSGEVPIS
jgi:O-antigen/teichoic acid export membrane protein